jgi:hypothetical protein
MLSEMRSVVPQENTDPDRPALSLHHSFLESVFREEFIGLRLLGCPYVDREFFNWLGQAGALMFNVIWAYGSRCGAGRDVRVPAAWFQEPSSLNDPSPGLRHSLLEKLQLSPRRVSASTSLRNGIPGLISADQAWRSSLLSICPHSPCI